MGEATGYKGIEFDKFFFAISKSIISSYPVIFSGRGSNKPHSAEHRQFKEKWGNIGVLYQIVEKKIEKVAEVYQYYLADYFQLLSYMIEEAEAEEAEEKYQDMLRKAKKGR